MAILKDESIPNPVIVGWKAIAAELGVSNKTARRWAREHNLPVYKLDVGEHTAVRVRRKDLMDWLRRHEVRVYARD